MASNYRRLLLLARRRGGSVVACCCGSYRVHWRSLGTVDHRLEALASQAQYRSLTKDQLTCSSNTLPPHLNQEQSVDELLHAVKMVAMYTVAGRQVGSHVVCQCRTHQSLPQFDTGSNSPYFASQRLTPPSLRSWQCLR